MMSRKQRAQKTHLDQVQSVVDLVAAYRQAIIARAVVNFDHLCAPEFELDFVYGDAFQTKPISGPATRDFWPAWFKAFPDGEFEATRTIAAETVVVVQWTFSGTHLAVLGNPIMNPALPPTQRIVCFRGVSIYDIAGDQIQRETTYLDLATVMVELGVTP